jgi:hypothetical protein
MAQIAPPPFGIGTIATLMPRVSVWHLIKTNIQHVKLIIIIPDRYTLPSAKIIRPLPQTALEAGPIQGIGESLGLRTAQCHEFVIFHFVFMMTF